MGAQVIAFPRAPQQSRPRPIAELLPVLAKVASLADASAHTPEPERLTHKDALDRIMANAKRDGRQFGIRQHMATIALAIAIEELAALAGDSPEAQKATRFAFDSLVRMEAKHA